MRAHRLWSFLGVLSLLPAGTLLAYNPPVDTAGPLTVRILEPALGNYGAGGPTQLNRSGMPFSLEVLLQNAEGAPLEGTLRVHAIDDWRVEPAAAAPFHLVGHGRAEMRFTITVGARAHNAHYPLHAIAEFTYQGRRLTAHPVLILATQLSDPPRAHLPLAWLPLPVPQRGAMGLWRLPLHRDIIQTVGGETRLISLAPETFETSQPVQFGVGVTRGQRREAIAMALGPRLPSRRERIASALIEYPLALPNAHPLRLQFAAATSGAPALFRVRVASFNAPEAQPGPSVFESRGGGSPWVNHEVNLDAFAGKPVRLQLEAQAEGSVEADWAEPALVVGAPAAPAPAPPRPLGVIERNHTRYEIRLRPGSRGLLDATVSFAAGGRELQFHGFHVRVAGDVLEDARSAHALTEVREEPANGRYRVRHRFRGWAGAFDLLGELWIVSGELEARFWLENAPPPRPWLAVYLEEVAAGPWSDRARRIYAGLGNVIQDPQAFQLPFDGHRLATSFVGFDFPGLSIVQGVDAVPDRLEVDPEGRIYTLSTPHAQTLTFLPVPTAWDGALAWRALSGKHAAAGVPKLAGRFVFDLWQGRYAESARALARAAQYGVTNAVVVWHNWQRWGYDYRLPDIYPPNPEFGTLEEFRQLVQTSKDAGVLFAPHDNYIDFYPDAEDFSYADIVFNRDGQPRKAWYHSYRQAQSYRFRPDKLRPFLERNVRLVQSSFAPTAYFIDVWSSMGPWDFWTEDGRFVPRGVTRQVWGESFAWIRDFLGGAPQISEAGHDQLIGWLDGAQANHLRVEAPPAQGFTWPIRAADAERIPWEDAAYHDVFVLHGAGYPDRYAAGLDERTHGIYSDDYIATEVLTGHPAMVADPFNPDVVRKYWLLDDLMRALALRRIEAVSFAGGDLHRQQVHWNGGEVWVNRGSSDWTVEGHVLPQYGYYARVTAAEGPVESAIERRGGAVVAWSRSPAAYYVQTRPEPGLRLVRDGQAVRLIPAPESGSFTARVHWDELPWRLPEPHEVEALDASGNVLRRAPAAGSAHVFTVEVAPDAFAWRLR